MAFNIKNHPIRDKNDSILKINNRESFILGGEEGTSVQRILVGVKSNETEVVTDPNTGYNYERNIVEGQEIYNLPKTKRHP